MIKIAGKKISTEAVVNGNLKVPASLLALGRKPRAKKSILNITIKKIQ